MLHAFLDTELTDLTSDAGLISIGIVDETGKRTFYAELSDTWSVDRCSEWVVKHVLPHLGEGRVQEAEAASRLAEWIDKFNDDVVLWTDAANHDWPQIQKLFSASWPQRLVKQPGVLPSVLSYDRKIGERYQAAVDAFWSKNDHAVRHHALWDAMAARAGWLGIPKSKLIRDLEDALGHHENPYPE